MVTTRNIDGSPNLAPMGPSVATEDPADGFELRPFQTSSTYSNLTRTGQGVLHISDNVLLFAQAVTGTLPADVAYEEAGHVDCPRLVDCCRYYEFETVYTDRSSHRSTMQCRVVHQDRVRNFAGFNRARHAVIEACILASRVEFLPGEEIQTRLVDLEPAVERTGGKREKQAFQIIREYIASYRQRETR